MAIIQAAGQTFLSCLGRSGVLRVCPDCTLRPFIVLFLVSSSNIRCHSISISRPVSAWALKTQTTQLMSPDIPVRKPQPTSHLCLSQPGVSPTGLSTSNAEANTFSQPSERSNQSHAAGLFLMAPLPLLSGTLFRDLPAMQAACVVEGMRGRLVN